LQILAYHKIGRNVIPVAVLRGDKARYLMARVRSSEQAKTRAAANKQQVPEGDAAVDVAVTPSAVLGERTAD
jgi:hypothetical protein